MEFIDFHTHIYPDAIAAKAANSVRAFYEGEGNPTVHGTAKMLLERGSMAGTSRFVILPVALRPENTRHINDFILQKVAEEPRFFGFGTIHAGMKNIIDEVDYIREKGLRGIKMHPDSQVFAIDDPRLFPAYELAEGKLPVILHMGDQRFDYSHPQRLRRVLDAFPRLQVIAAHFGGYSMYETACQILSDKECFFDVSSSLMFMQEGEAEKYINHYGAERFVYGDDFPMWHPVKEMARFRKLKLTDRQFEQIGHETAEYLLKLR